MLSSFTGSFDFGRDKPVFGLDRTNRPTFYLDAGLSSSYSGSGSTWTDLRGGNDGTLTNSPTFSTDRFTFNGSNNYVDMPDGFADFTSGFTCFFVANFTSTGSWARLMDFGNSDSSNNIILARSGTSSTMAFQIYNGIGQAITLDFQVSSAILDNQLCSYAVTLDGSNAYMYRDGVQIGTTATATLPNNISRTNCYIARSNWVADSYFQGDIAVALLWDRALTGAQIKSNHNYFAQRYYIDSQYTVESFTSGTTTWTPPLGVTSIEYLVAGGGGGGGTGYDNSGAGGGGGGMVRTGTLPVSNQRYTITVGAGGSGGADTRANNSGSSGSDSIFGPITSLGGGYGKGCRTNTGTGEAAQVGITTAPTGGDGNGGGFDGGGGGGATGAGGAGGGSPGAAGAGLTSTISGSSVTYGAGGAGGYNGGPYDGAAGSANTGTGGGGGSSPSSNSAGGGAGGSGIVILKYAPVVAPVSTDLIYHLDASNTDSYPTTGTAVTDLTSTLGDATLVGGPTWTNGGKASYWTFSNDYLITPDLTTPMSGESHSTECWIYPTANGVVVNYAGQSDPQTSYHHSAIEIVAGNLEFGLWDGTAITSTGSTGSISLNTWHHVVLTYDGTTCRGYLDGGLVGSVSVSWDSPHVNGGGSNEIRMGFGTSDVTDQGDGTYFDGRFSIIRVYTGALSATEILQNFNAERERFGV